MPFPPPLPQSNQVSPSWVPDTYMEKGRLLLYCIMLCNNRMLGYVNSKQVDDELTAFFGMKHAD